MTIKRVSRIEGQPTTFFLAPRSIFPKQGDDGDDDDDDLTSDNDGNDEEKEDSSSDNVAQ